MASAILHLPKHCNIYQNLLVEELVFHKSPLNYHYGKCSVIGKLVYDEVFDKYFLENIRLRCLDKKYQMKTGAIRIRLLVQSRPEQTSIGSFAEVHGETGFVRPSESEFNLQTGKQNTVEMKTTVDFIKRMRIGFLKFNEETQGVRNSDDDIDADTCQINQRGLDEFLETFPVNFEPVIKLFTINIIDQAEELIECNLKMRMVMRKLNQIPE